MNDRSNEALLARRAKAEAATPGKWQQCEAYRVFGTNGKDVPAVATDDDIFMVAEPLENAANDAAHIAANSPDVTIADIDEILRLRAENARLDREADWLAQQVNSWEHDQLDGTGNDIREVPELREQARKAVEKAYKDSKEGE